jgi:dimethylaniline monooxygenase (N-oxide forming)
MKKKIGIIGAGVSGLVTAKTCIEYGFEVKVFEKDQELGGVWASSRRYPGLSTQNTKDTYFFSDFPMPDSYPQWPSGRQVQSYLISYAEKFNVIHLIKFKHEITEIHFKENMWAVVGQNRGGHFTEYFDFLIICNGTFSDPHIPTIPGVDSFIAAGGQMSHSSQFKSTNTSRDKHAVVVGYSKSANDVAAAISKTATNTVVVYREAKWKVPLAFKGIPLKYVLLNRFGEAMLKPDRLNRIERFIHRTGLPKKILPAIENYISKKQNLRQLGLLPNISMVEQSFGEIMLETTGFFKQVEKGRITPKQGEISSFNGKQITLTNGEQFHSDLVIFGTGFKQTIPFLPDHLTKDFIDEQGNYILYRHILPAGIPSLAFVGYNSSFFSTLTSEIAALWVCEFLMNRIAKPSATEIIEEGTSFLKWRSGFRTKSSSKGLSTIPGSIQHVDLLMKDMKVSLPFFSLLADWLILTKPSRYKSAKDKVMQRNK